MVIKISKFVLKENPENRMQFQMVNSLVGNYQSLRSEDDLAQAKYHYLHKQHGFSGNESGVSINVNIIATGYEFGLNQWELS